jgi:hypothetical protein
MLAVGFKNTNSTLAILTLLCMNTAQVSYNK